MTPHPWFSRRHVIRKGLLLWGLCGFIFEINITRPESHSSCFASALRNGKIKPLTRKNWNILQIKVRRAERLRNEQQLQTAAVVCELWKSHYVEIGLNLSFLTVQSCQDWLIKSRRKGPVKARQLQLAEFSELHGCGLLTLPRIFWLPVKMQISFFSVNERQSHTAPF